MVGPRDDMMNMYKQEFPSNTPVLVVGSKQRDRQRWVKTKKQEKTFTKNVPFTHEKVKLPDGSVLLAIKTCMHLNCNLLLPQTYYK